MKVLTNSINPTCYGKAMIKIKQRYKMIVAFSCCLLVAILSAHLIFLYGQGKLFFTYLSFTSRTSGIFAIIFHMLNFLCCCIFTYANTFSPVFFLHAFYHNIGLMEIKLENIINNINGTEDDVISQNLKDFIQTLQETLR